jgi:type IV pilus assembly protein PilY1
MSMHTRTFPPVVRSALTLLATLTLCASPRAEDIDIYAGVPADADRPNVLIVLDNSANWSASLGASCSLVDEPGYVPSSQESGSKMAIEKCALYNLFHSLPTRPDGSAKVNIGLMLFNESPAANSGGYPRRALTPLTAATRALLKKTIRDLDATADKSNNAAFAKSLHEAFLMLSGAAPYRGTAGTKWDSAAVANGRYVLPAADGCARNFIIFIGNGGPGENTDAEARDLLAGLGGDTTMLSFPAAYIKKSDQANWADEYTRFMNSADVSGGDGRQNVVTHTIAVTGASSDGLYPNFLRSMANQGGGSFYEARDASSLTTALNEIFNQIQSVDSVFSAVSLPLSASRQGTFQNQIFVGMFRPDPLAKPRWMGNLKQYQVAFDVATDSLTLVDSEGRAAISAATGFINPNARSFWTDPNTFWVNRPSGTPVSASDSPDGEISEKGGAGQRLRTTYSTNQDARRVLTCVDCASGTALSSLPFATGNASITPALLGVDAATRDQLIAWVRGHENVGNEGGPGEAVTVRPSIHGDVLHSRPVVVDYGGTTGVVVFYGTNDGLLRAARGAQTGTGAGAEMWSFVAQEFFGKLVRQRDNAPAVRYPTTSTLVTATPRDYFFDGPIGIYRDSATNRTIIYPTMRRGGRVVYAIDVTDPDAPRFLWKTGGSAVSVLGQTWSEPRVARIRGLAGPALVMGAGYDEAAEDVDPPQATTRGNAVLVLDALTGTVLRQFSGTARSVAADVSLVDSDFDGYVDRAYAADLGANLYRIDFEDAAGALGASAWTMTRLAALGDASGTRKFFYAPDVVVSRGFTGVMLGSGDREKPLKSVGSDRFYVIKDPKVTKGAPVDAASPFTESVLQAIGADGSDAKGCYLPLASGEKVVTGSSSIAGTSYFSTNRPTPASPLSCRANLGEARAYELPLFCKTANSQVLTGGGLPPSPVVGVLQVSVGNTGAGGATTRVVPFVIGGINTKKSPLEIKKVTPVIPVKRRRPYWYVESDR